MYGHSSAVAVYPTDRPFLAVYQCTTQNQGGLDSKLIPLNPNGKTIYFNASGTVKGIYFNGTGVYATTNIESGYEIYIYTHD